MTNRPFVATHAPAGHAQAQVRAILRNLSAKTLAHFTRNEVTHLRQMSDRLIDLAQQVGTQSRSYRLRSLSFLLDKQTAVPSSIYQDALKDALQEEVKVVMDAGQTDAAARGTTDGLEGMTLTLIDASEMDRLLCIDLVAQRFNSQYESQLQTLNQRLGSLITGKFMALTGNPFRPEVLIRALMAGWKKSGFDEPTCNDLLGSLSPKHSIDLAPLYDDMNAILAQAGVTLKTVHRIRKSANADTGAGGFGNDGAGEPDPSSSGDGAMSQGAPLSERGEFGRSGRGGGGAFERSAGGNSGNRGNSDTAGQADAGAAAPADAPTTGYGTGTHFGGTAPALEKSGYGRFTPLGQSIATRARQFLQRLGFDRGGDAGGAVADGFPTEMIHAPVDARLMGYLGGLQPDAGAAFVHESGDSQDPMTGHNVLRRMREQVQVKQAPEIDRGTVDALSEV
ncbi:MAG: DUF1631 family protein, partial [Betaproteobacteria bacterium]